MCRHAIPALCLLALFFIGGHAQSGGKPEKDYQARVEALPWRFSEKAASPVFCARKLQKPYEATVEPWGSHLASIVVKKDNKVVFEWLTGHMGTVFVVTGDTFYYSYHSPIATGCQLIAVDLKTGKELWKTSLRGLGLVTHKKYLNEVNLNMEDADTLRVFGRESAGGYIELVDRHSGKTVGNRRYKAEEMEAP